MANRLVVLDTETTGLAAEDGHRIIEIGCVELENRRLTGRNWHQYLNPQREIDEGAMQVHGLSLDMLQDKPVFNDIADEFLAFVQGAEILIHNAAFDVGFLNAELARGKRKLFETHCGRVTDTLAMARELHPGRRNSLDVLCDRYGISNAHRKLHGALLDAELLADVYLAMTRGQDSLMMTSVAHQARQQADDGADWPPAGLLSVAVNDAQAAAHEQMLDLIEADSGAAALWRRREQGEDVELASS